VLFGCGLDLGEIIEDVARLGARLLTQTAIEAEVDEFLGLVSAENYLRPGHSGLDHIDGSCTGLGRPGGSYR
jgi:hypothetical protein